MMMGTPVRTYLRTNVCASQEEIIFYDKTEFGGTWKEQKWKQGRLCADHGRPTWVRVDCEKGGVRTTEEETTIPVSGAAPHRRIACVPLDAERKERRKEKRERNE